MFAELTAEPRPLRGLRQTEREATARTRADSGDPRVDRNRNPDFVPSAFHAKTDNGFLYSGPRIQELSTNTFLTAGDTKPCATGLTSCFEALPNVTNTWQQMKMVRLIFMF